MSKSSCPKGYFSLGDKSKCQCQVIGRGRAAVQRAEVSVVLDSLPDCTTALTPAPLDSLLRSLSRAWKFLSPGVRRAPRYEPRAVLAASQSHTWFYGLTHIKAELPRTRCVFCAIIFLTPRLNSQVSGGHPFALTSLSGFPRACGEEKLRLLPERVTVPSPGVLKATVPLKQWECSAPLQVYVKAPGNCRHLSPPSPTPAPSFSLPPLEISLQVTGRLSHTRPH